MLESLKAFARTKRGLLVAILAIAVVLPVAGLFAVTGALLVVERVAPNAPAQIAPHVFGSLVPNPSANGISGTSGGAIKSNVIPVNPTTTILEPTHPWILTDGGSVAMRALKLGIGDSVVYAGTWQENLPRADAGSQTANGQIQFFGHVDYDGVLRQTNMGTAQTVVTNNVGAAIDGGVAFIWDAGPAPGLGSLTQVAYGGQPATYSVNISGMLNGELWNFDAGGPPAVLGVFPSSNSYIVDAGGGAGLQLAIQVSYGAAGSPDTPATVTSVTIGGYPCTNPFVWTPGIIGCTMPNATYDAGALNGYVAVVMGPPNPWGMAAVTPNDAGFSFVTVVNPIITSIYPTAAGASASGEGPYEGSQAITITCSGSTCGGMTALSLGGVNVTSLTCGSSSCTAVTGVGPSVNGGLVNAVASPGSSTIGNGYFYYPQGLYTLNDSETGITTATGVSAWADVYTSSGLSWVQATGGSQPTYTASCSGSRHCLSTTGSSFMTMASWAPASKQITACLVLSVTTAAGISSDLLTAPAAGGWQSGNGYVLFAGSTTDMTVGESISSTVNYANSSATSMTSLGLWCSTFDRTVGGGTLGVTATYNGTLLTLGAPSATSAMDNANFPSQTMSMFGTTTAGSITASIAKIAFFKQLLNSTQLASVRTYWKDQYSTLP